MSNLAIFAFEGQEVRFVGTPEKPEWIAQDVCNILENGEAYNILRNFDEDEKGLYSIQTLGGEQQMLTVTESGVYRLVFKSRKLVAKRFQKWVTSEVLPSIRKTGKYEVPAPEPQPQSADPTPQLGEREVFLLEVLKLGIDTAKYVKDDRAVLVYNTQLQNLSQRTVASLTGVGRGGGVNTLHSLPEPIWLTVSEVLERAGFSISQKAYQNTLGQIGKRVKAYFIAETGEPLKSVEKAVGTNHRSADIKLYPEHYHERIVEIALEYWYEKGIGMN